MGRQDPFRGDRQQPIAGSKQVNLDGVCTPKNHILALLKIKPLALTGSLVRGAYNLDSRHHPMA